VILAPFLPIVVSGLYTILNIERLQKVQVQQVDWFQNLSQSLQSADIKLVVLPGLIAQQNLTYPQWTYDELVLPTVNLATLEPTTKIEIPENATSLAMQVPTLRGRMNCSVLTRLAYQQDRDWNLQE
jgi:hypothetical protein